MCFSLSWQVLEQLMRDEVLSTFRIDRSLDPAETSGGDMAETGAEGSKERERGGGEGEREGDETKVMDSHFLEVARLATEDEDEGGGRIINFEVDASKVKEIKERCSKDIDWPLLEEYDFRNDPSNPELPIELKSDTQIREYQSKALSRMFSNHRARSGIIVLPCGAGKTLVLSALDSLGFSLCDRHRTFRYDSCFCRSGTENLSLRYTRALLPFCWCSVVSIALVTSAVSAASTVVSSTLDARCYLQL